MIVLALALNSLRPGPATSAPAVTKTAEVALSTPTADPTAPLLVQLAQAQDKIGAGAWHEALALVEGVSAADPGFQATEVSEARFTACFNLAWHAERDDEFAQALSNWGCALEEYPIDGVAQASRRRADLYQQALAASAAVDHAQAVATWQQLYDESPANADVVGKLYEARVAYGDALCRSGESKASEQGRIWEQNLGAYDTIGVTFDLTANAKVGDKFYFITGALGEDNADNTIFEPGIELQNLDGVDLPEVALWAEGTPTPVVTPTSPPPPQPALCFQPKLRHYEPHIGCCAEVGGVVINRQGQPFAPRGAVVRIEGPLGRNQYVREFAIAADGGYNVTALSVNPYTIWLKDLGIRSSQFAVTFPDPANIREIVDFFQTPC